MQKRNNIIPALMFEEVEPLLYKLAWKFANDYPYPSKEEMFLECRSIAYRDFMDACAKYKPKRNTSFSSYVYMRAWYGMKSHITERTKDPLVPMELNDDLTGAAPHYFNAAEMVEDLSADAKEIVSLILETPQDLLGGVPTTARQLMRRVKDYMIKHRGRTEEQINQAHIELRVRFSEIFI